VGRHRGRDLPRFRLRGPREINTDSCAVDCVEGVACEIAAQSDGTEVAVIVAARFAVEEDVRVDVVGARPLVILAAADVEIDGTISAGEAADPNVGQAGGYSCDSALEPLDGNGPGGGGVGYIRINADEDGVDIGGTLSPSLDSGCATLGAL
jgi:hypothetical protein